MKTFLKVVVAILIVSSAGIFTSCSKSTYTHKYSTKSRGSASTINPAARKSEPVRKNYVINNKRRKILGNEKPAFR
ncbi:MAG: hypothetical protein L3J66_05470 [Bacteroidales bacterium]|nr:hypothetical protein [Bacteroidales bacterium]